MLRRTTRLLVKVCILFFLYSHQATALETSEAEKTTPIEIRSDAAEFDDTKGTATYHGHVEMIQDCKHLFSDQLVITRDNHNKIEKMIATGIPAFFFFQPDPNKPTVKGQAETIQYFPKQENIILLTNATLNQDSDTITGDHLTYSLKSRELVAVPQPGKRTTIILGPQTKTSTSNH